MPIFKLRFKEYTGPGGAEVEVEKPAKEEFAIAKWIKKNVPTKKTKFLNHNVEYFTGEHASYSQSLATWRFDLFLSFISTN